jgi:hypothetical protein
MIGLLQELGPCRINNDSASVTLNPFSWNNNSNMLFIDQPVGVGFSHGTESVGSSQDAAADIWSFLQIFLKDSRFSKLAANDLAIWTESSVAFVIGFHSCFLPRGTQVRRPLWTYVCSVFLVSKHGHLRR